MSQSTSVAVVSAPAQQQVAAPARTPLAERMFPSHQAPAKRTASHAEIQEWRSTIAAAEAKDRAETVARMRPEHIALAERTAQRFMTLQLAQWIKETGIGHSVWAHDFVGRMGMHIEKLEAEVAQLRGRR